MSTTTVNAFLFGAMVFAATGCFAAGANSLGFVLIGAALIQMCRTWDE